MGLFDMWREARGDVLRKQFEDVMARVRAANPNALFAFYNNLENTIEPLREEYRPASSSERKAIIKRCRRSANDMWNRGDWPSSLGLGISALNIESEFVPGKDAAYVKAETDKIIQEAREYFKKRRREGFEALRHGRRAKEPALRRLLGPRNVAGGDSFPLGAQPGLGYQQRPRHPLRRAHRRQPCLELLGLHMRPSQYDFVPWRRGRS